MWNSGKGKHIYIYTWDESDFIFSDSNRCITCNAPETSYNKNYMVTGPCFLWYPETNPTGRPSPLHCVPAKWWRWAVLPKLSHEWTGSKMPQKHPKTWLQSSICRMQDSEIDGSFLSKHGRNDWFKIVFHTYLKIQSNKAKEHVTVVKILFCFN